MAPRIPYVSGSIQKFHGSAIPTVHKVGRDLEVMEGCFDVADVIDEDPSVGGPHRHHHPVQLKVQGRAGTLQCHVQHTLPTQILQRTNTLA
jgi:hypothetical protein